MKKYLILVPIMVFLLATNLGATIITDTETVGDGLYATLDWNPGATLTWSVTYPDQSVSGHYEYTYIFNTGSGDDSQISHLIIQVSGLGIGPGTFQFEDMLSGTSELNTDTNYPLLDEYTGGAANPGLPVPSTNPIYGIKWEEPNPQNSDEWTITIVTNRAPMDGNFYAVDGKGSTPTYAYTGDQDGFGYNILVPDTLTQGKVPEPMTLILYGFGFAGAGLYTHLRRRAK